MELPLCVKASCSLYSKEKSRAEHETYFLGGFVRVSLSHNCEVTSSLVVSALPSVLPWLVEKPNAILAPLHEVIGGTAASSKCTSDLAHRKEIDLMQPKRRPAAGIC